MSDGLVIVSLLFPYCILSNVRWVSDCFLTVIAVGKIWLELFEDIIFFIPFHIFFMSLMFS